MVFSEGEGNGCTLLDWPFGDISSTKIQMTIKTHLNQVSLDKIIKRGREMKSLIKKYLSVLAFIVIPLFMFGCSSKEEIATNVAEDIKINSGAVLKSEEGTYKLYNFENGNYKKSENNNNIIAYDKNSMSYMITSDKRYYLIHNGEKIEIQDNNYSKIKLSKGSKYVSYFIEESGLKLKIFDVNENKELEIKSNVSISGTFYDWYDANTLVYYGVSNEGVNGLFLYNIEENKEELLYKIKDGYAAYLEQTEDKLLFLKVTLENKKELMAVDKKTKDVNILLDNIEQLSDIISYKGKIFFTGKILNNKNSLYELSGNKAKRIVFDFPSIVKIEKGLSIDDNGNILFIGSESGNTEEEQIYSYSKDGNISVISESSNDYMFLDYYR